MNTKVSLKNIISLYAPGTEEDIIGTSVLQKHCVDYYKESPEHLEYVANIKHFTRKFKEQWNIVYPENPLLTNNIRSPGSRTKRGIAKIKRVQHP